MRAMRYLVLAACLAGMIALAAFSPERKPMCDLSPGDAARWINCGR
jgi:hypothetical protein